MRNELKSRYSAPIQLLLAYLNVSGGQLLGELSDKIQPSDWETFKGIAKNHMVSSLTYNRIRNYPCEIQVPPDILKRMREDYLSAIYENTRLYRTLSTLLNEFQQRNIAVMVLKGAYLAEKVYGNIALRIMGDIDLLIPKQDLSRAYQIAIQQGYSPTFTFDLNEEIVHRHSLPPLLFKGKPQVDMHWAFFPPNLPFHFDEDALWSQSNQDTLCGVNIHSLRPEHLLLHLCFHFAYMHRYMGQLFQLCDISQVLVRYQNSLDWEFFTEQVRDWGMVKAIYLALEAARQLLDAPIPAPVLASIEPKDFQTDYLIWLVDQMLESHNFSTNLAGLWGADSLKKRLNLTLQGIFWSPRIMREKYPKLASGTGLPLAYLLRIYDVARRQLPRVWKLLSKDLPSQNAARQFQNIEVIGRWMESR
jgi:hypothetical protein